MGRGRTSGRRPERETGLRTARREAAGTHGAVSAPRWRKIDCTAEKEFIFTQKTFPKAGRETQDSTELEKHHGFSKSLRRKPNQLPPN